MQNLDKFKNEMNLSGQNVYVGHRYVPKILGEWNNENIYEPLSIVQYQGNSFTSRQYVPVGIEITNEEYWASTGNYNAQIEQYRQDVRNLENDISEVNSEVITARNGAENLSDRLDGDINTLLVKINKKTQINPDDFEGNDLQKIISAIEAAKLIKGGLILTRMYDITGLGHIELGSKDDDYLFSIIGQGGGIEKRDKGYIFDRTVGGRFQDLFISNLNFKSEVGAGTIAYNGDHLVRLKLANNMYNHVDQHTKALDYVQSLRSINEITIGGLGPIFEVASLHDMTVTHLSGEGKGETKKFFEYTNNPITTTQINSLRFTHSLVEGVTGNAFEFNGKVVENATIENNFMEANGGHIYFADNCAVKSSSISNNRVWEFEGKADNKSFIRWPRQVESSQSQNNSCWNMKIHDTSITNDDIASINDWSNKQNLGNRIVDFKVDRTTSTEAATGTHVTKMGYFKRFTQKYNVTMSGGYLINASLKFPEKITRDDIVSIQIKPTSTNNTDKTNNGLVGLRHYYVATDDTEGKLNIVLNNYSGDSLPVELFITILKFHVSITG